MPRIVDPLIVPADGRDGRVPLVAVDAVTEDEAEEEEEEDDEYCSMSFRNLLVLIFSPSTSSRAEAISCSSCATSAFT